MLNDELIMHGAGSPADQGISAYITQTFLGNNNNNLFITQ